MARIYDRIERRRRISATPFVMTIQLIMNFRSVYKELHADHETGAADNK